MEVENGTLQFRVIFHFHDYGRQGKWDAFRGGSINANLQCLCNLEGFPVQSYYNSAVLGLVME